MSRPDGVPPATTDSVQGSTMSRAASFLLVALVVVLPALVAGCSPSQQGEKDAAPASSTDTAGDTVAAASPQTFYVHLRVGTDPEAFARRYGLSPSEVITDPRPGLVVALTPDQRDSLAADTLVRSLARRIHSGGAADSGPALRSLGGDTAGG